MSSGRLRVVGEGQGVVGRVRYEKLTLSKDIFVVHVLDFEVCAGFKKVDERYHPTQPTGADTRRQTHRHSGTHT